MNMFSHSILASLQCHLDLTCHVGFHIIYRPYENVSGNRELCKICMIQLYSLNTAWNIPTLSQPLCKSLFRKKLNYAWKDLWEFYSDLSEDSETAGWLE